MSTPCLAVRSLTLASGRHWRRVHRAISKPEGVQLSFYRCSPAPALMLEASITADCALVNSRGRLRQRSLSRSRHERASMPVKVTGRRPMRRYSFSNDLLPPSTKAAFSAAVECLEHSWRFNEMTVLTGSAARRYRLARTSSAISDSESTVN